MQSPYSSQDPLGGGSFSEGPQLAMPSLTPVVRWLLVANASLWALLFVVWLVDPGAPAAANVWLGIDPRAWKQLLIPIWQPFTYGFLHAVPTPFHLFWNMLQLYFFGTLLEGIVGPRRFAVFYGGAMLSGALLHLAMGLLSVGVTAPAVGASGAVLGVVVGAAVLRPHARVILLLFPISLMWLAIGIVAIDAIQLASALRVGGSDGVAHWVHLGGALFGFLAARYGLIWRDPVAELERKVESRKVQRAQDDELEMDRLLEKIHREGMSALSRREREFLKRVSRRR